MTPFVYLSIYLHLVPLVCVCVFAQTSACLGVCAHMYPRAHGSQRTTLGSGPQEHQLPGVILRWDLLSAQSSPGRQLGCQPVSPRSPSVSASMGFQANCRSSCLQSRHFTNGVISSAPFKTSFTSPPSWWWFPFFSVQIKLSCIGFEDWQYLALVTRSETVLFIGGI